MKIFWKVLLLWKLKLKRKRIKITYVSKFLGSEFILLFRIEDSLIVKKNIKFRHMLKVIIKV